MKAIRLFSVVVLACVMLMSCNKHEQFTVTVNVNDSSMGTVTGGGVYEKNSVATLTAVPNPNFQFVSWKNGSTKNPRTVTVVADASYTAIFEFVGGEFVVGSITVVMGDNTWEANSFYADAQTMPGKIRFWLYENEESEYPQIQGWMDITSTGTVESDLVYMANEDDVDESGMPNWEAVDLTTTLTSVNLDIQNITAVQTGKLRNRTTGEEIFLHIEYSGATWLNIPEVTRKFVLAK
jgi:hypothetical protein